MERDFILNWRVGARTAIFITNLANRYASRVTPWTSALGRHGLNGKDIMTWLMLDLKAGDRVLLAVDGSDAAAAMERLAELFTLGERLDYCPYYDCPSTPILVSYDDEWVQYGCSRWHAWCSPRVNPMREYTVSIQPLHGHA